MNSEPLSFVDIPLPPGRMITSDEGDGEQQTLWLSDGPVSAGLWERIHADHASTGLWPLLLDSRDPFDTDFRPWGAGEVFPERMSSPDTHDPAELLAKWWKDYTAHDEDDDVLSPEERLAVTAPFGQLWPGLASSSSSPIDPDEMAAEYAEHFASRRPQSRLGLVAAATGSDALTVAGWDGPVNYDNDTAKFSAVVRGWEQRFGARVVAVGPATLHLSVAAPPTTTEDAQLVAAEHFAFCPDNVWQNSHRNALAAYAERLIATHYWEFWWD
ncbi:hypothetical protein P3T37_002685 [Kitasatospora sp. MAA4]|uniref:DUF4253 domain-containing protein n=1 Tax=Kitasatospora sp. MAA4 TaxID=3035093 RepID=UPI00247520A0|nr:DUF4253 domain-containing protein [Kitasatospora sp. MAA4]MDH6133290.1 hypothetical protein [Kitasatospora sp. MAA4]